MSNLDLWFLDKLYRMGENWPYIVLGYVLLMVLIVLWCERESIFLRRRRLGKIEKKKNFLKWYSKKIGGDLVDIHICNGHWYFIYPETFDGIREIVDVVEKKLPDNPCSVIFLNSLLYDCVHRFKHNRFEHNGFEEACDNMDYTDATKDYLYNLLCELHKEEYKKDDRGFWLDLCQFVDRPRWIIKELEKNMEKKKCSHQDLDCLREALENLHLTEVTWWHGLPARVKDCDFALYTNRVDNFYRLITAMNHCYKLLQNKWSISYPEGGLMSEDTGTCFIGMQIPEQEMAPEEEEKAIEEPLCMAKIVSDYLADDLVYGENENPVKEIHAMSNGDFLIVTTKESLGNYDDAIIDSMGNFDKHEDEEVNQYLPAQFEVISEISIDDSQGFVSCKLHYLVREICADPEFNTEFGWKEYDTSWLPLQYQKNLNCELMNAHFEFKCKEDAEAFRKAMQNKYADTLGMLDMPNPYNIVFHLHCYRVKLDDMTFECGNMHLFSPSRKSPARDDHNHSHMNSIDVICERDPAEDHKHHIGGEELKSAKLKNVTQYHTITGASSPMATYTYSCDYGGIADVTVTGTAAGFSTYEAEMTKEGVKEVEEITVSGRPEEESEKKSNAEMMGAVGHGKAYVSNKANDIQSILEDLDKACSSLEDEVEDIRKASSEEQAKVVSVDDVMEALSKSFFRQHPDKDLVEKRKALLEYTSNMYEKVKEKRYMLAYNKELLDFAKMIVTETIDRVYGDYRLIQLSVGSYLIYHNHCLLTTSKIIQQMHYELREKHMPHINFMVISGNSIVSGHPEYQDLALGVFEMFFMRSAKADLQSGIEIEDYRHSHDSASPMISLKFDLKTDKARFRELLLEYYGGLKKGSTKQDVEWVLTDDCGGVCYRLSLPKVYFGSNKEDAEEESKFTIRDSCFEKVELVTKADVKEVSDRLAKTDLSVNELRQSVKDIIGSVNLIKDDNECGGEVITELRKGLGDVREQLECQKKADLAFSEEILDLKNSVNTKLDDFNKKISFAYNKTLGIPTPSTQKQLETLDKTLADIRVDMLNKQDLDISRFNLAELSTKNLSEKLDRLEDELKNEQHHQKMGLNCTDDKVMSLCEDMANLRKDAKTIEKTLLGDFQHLRDYVEDVKSEVSKIHKDVIRHESRFDVAARKTIAERESKKRGVDIQQYRELGDWLNSTNGDGGKDALESVIDSLREKVLAFYKAMDWDRNIIKGSAMEDFARYFLIRKLREISDDIEKATPEK